MNKEEAGKRSARCEKPFTAWRWGLLALLLLPLLFHPEPGHAKGLAERFDLRERFQLPEGLDLRERFSTVVHKLGLDRTTAPVQVSFDDFPLYAKAGFSPAYAALRADSKLDGWQLFPANSSGRRINLTMLDYPGKEPHRPFDFGPPDVREFTLLIPFKLDAADWAALRRTSPSMPVPAVYLAALGDNWEIWLNGSLIRREMHLEADGSISLHRTIKKVIAPFDVRLLSVGNNTLAIRVLGDVKYPTTGLHLKGPHYLGDLAGIEKTRGEVPQLIFIGLYVFVGLYHLFLFSRRTKDHYNLYYGLFSILLGFYLFTRMGSFFVADSNLASRMELVSLYTVIPLVGAFIEHLNRGRVSRITIAYSFVSLAFMVLAAAFSMNVTHYSLRVWQLTGLAMAAFYWFVRIQYEYLRATFKEWRSADSATRRPWLVLFISGLFVTPRGNIVIGATLLLVTGVYDIVNSMFWHFSLVITPWGFLLFTLGTALVLANRFEFLYARVSELNNSLDERFQDLTRTTKQLAMSEKKYRSLFEGSSEPVALLDRNLRFIEGNRAAVEFFALDRPAHEQLCLADTLFCDEREGNRPVRNLELAVSSLTARNPAREDSFRFRTPLGEAKTCLLRLERIQSGEEAELLIRLSPDPESLLATAFVEGRETWLIESSLAAADEACRHMGEHIKRYLKEEDANYLMVCLREMVINAIEHGNLEVSYDDKTATQAAGRYFDFLRERQSLPAYRNRRVRIEYSINRERATFRITDEGKGFNYKRFLSADMEAAPELLEHGRGLFMTLNAFDTVLYNEKGNQVTLLKKLSQDSGPLSDPAGQGR